jgi:hypothetical protein
VEEVLVSQEMKDCEQEEVNDKWTQECEDELKGQEVKFEEQKAEQTPTGSTPL